VVVLLGLAMLVVVELYVFVQTAQWLGFFTALLAVIVVSAVGFALVKREGIRTLQRFQHQARQGHLPSRELADTVALLVAGGLLLFPGLFTDVVGLVLLTPPVRAVMRRWLIAKARRLSGTTTIITTTSTPLEEPPHRD
jgi:UPF0716 protein FxsA